MTASSLRHFIRLAISCGAFLLDVAAVLSACLIGDWLRYDDLAYGNWIQTFVLAFPVYFLSALALKGYAQRTVVSVGRSFFAAATSLLIGAGFSMSAIFALKVANDTSRLATGYSLVIALVLLVVFRVLLAIFVRRFLHRAVATRFVVLTDGVEPIPHGPTRVMKIVNVRDASLVPAFRDPSFFDALNRLVANADRIVLSFDDPDERVRWSAVMQLSGLDAEIVADLGEVRPLALSHWNDHPTLVISRRPLNIVERAVKRLFDLFVSIALMPVALPVMGLTALAIRLDSPGPILFVQERMGRNKTTYRCYKFRSMYVDQLDGKGVASTTRGDCRITRVGRFLRLTSIDELPQLFNVLAGDMSLVGPRPHALGSRAEGSLFWELVPDYWSRHSMKPGVTGLAQVRGLRGATHSREDIEHRVAADLEYINGWSLWLDIKILAKTPLVVIHRNAY